MMAFVVGLCVGAFVGAVVTAILVQRDTDENAYATWNEEAALFNRLEREWRWTDDDPLRPL